MTSVHDHNIDLFMLHCIPRFTVLLHQLKFPEVRAVMSVVIISYSSLIVCIDYDPDRLSLGGCI